MKVGELTMQVPLWGPGANMRLTNVELTTEELKDLLGVANKLLELSAEVARLSSKAPAQTVPMGTVPVA